MQSGWIEIVFLAMLAGFIALRLYSVLGRRTGHEKPVADPFRPARPEMSRPGPAGRTGQDASLPADLPADMDQSVREGLTAIMAADRQFNPQAFLGNARTAYAMVLESFWTGHTADLQDLVSDEVLEQFDGAIAQRKSAGETQDNKLLGITSARIVEANMNGSMAEVTVRFDSEILSVTRDAEGRIIAGDPNDAVETHDLWTFSRHTAAADPAWLLVDVDEDSADA